MTALEQFFGWSELPSTLCLQQDNAKTHAGGRLSDISRFSNDEEIGEAAVGPVGTETHAPLKRRRSHSNPSLPSLFLVKDRALPLQKKATSFTVGSYKTHFSNRMPKALFQLGPVFSDSSTTPCLDARWNESSDELLPISPIRRASVDMADIPDAVAKAQCFAEETCIDDSIWDGATKDGCASNPSTSGT